MVGRRRAHPVAGSAIDQGIYALSAVDRADRRLGRAATGRRGGPPAARGLVAGLRRRGAARAGARPRARSSAAVDHRLGADGWGLVVWDDAGEPVSFAGFGGATPNGIRIGPVYTPPDHAAAATPPRWSPPCRPSGSRRAGASASSTPISPTRSRTGSTSGSATSGCASRPRSSSAHRLRAGRQSGMLPCLRRGPSHALGQRRLERRRSGTGRVRRGSITSSTYPRSAAAYGLANRSL